MRKSWFCLKDFIFLIITIILSQFFFNLAHFFVSEFFWGKFNWESLVFKYFKVHRISSFIGVFLFSLRFRILVIFSPQFINQILLFYRLFGLKWVVCLNKFFFLSGLRLALFLNNSLVALKCHLVSFSFNKLAQIFIF